MKLRLLAVSLVVLMIVPTTVWASLRTLGSIEAVGLASENALHVGVLLKDCEWEAVASSDGGRTWRLAKRAKLPASLAPLPARGEIRYQIVDGRLILRSDNSGATWSDISPWRFLGEAVRQDVDAEKKRFLAKYGHWLPESEVWLFSFVGTVAGVLAVGGWYLRRLRKEWMPPVALSLAAYCLFALGLFAAHAWFINWFCSEQWSYRLGH